MEREREKGEGEALSMLPGSGSTCTPTKITFRPTQSCNHGNRVVILVDRLWPRPRLKEKGPVWTKVGPSQ